MNPICQKCQKKPAEVHPVFGVLLCPNCQADQNRYSLPNTYPPDMVGNSIKYQRKAFKRDIIQKYRYGELSREWVDAYPEKARKNHTKEERRQAKNVWHGDL